MAQPTAYERQTSFSDYAEAHVSAPFNAESADEEFDAAKVTLDAICANLALIQRDDGRIANGVVTPDSLSSATLALIAGDWTPRGNWATSTAYAVGDVVQNASGGITTAYVCSTAHTSGTLSTDVTAGKFIALGATITGAASSISFSATGGIVATDVQAAIAEVDSEKLAKASNLSDVASPATARSSLSVPSTAELQQQTYTHAASGGTADAITAAYTPTISALTNRMRLSFVAASANATTTPTFSPDGLTARTIVKGANSALAAGDIPGQYAVCTVEYNSTLDKWVLLNPALPAGALATVGGTMTGDLVMSGACLETAHGADIASAATLNLETATGNVVDVTGTTTITAVTLSEGHQRLVRFTAALTLTHGASLILPGAGDITTAAGDYALFVGYALGVVRCVYMPLKGGPVGTKTNDSATAGNVGELISSTIVSGSAVALTTGTPADVTSISLTPGDWDVYFVAQFKPNSSSSLTYLAAGIFSTTATLPANDLCGQWASAANVVGNELSLHAVPQRISLAATTTYYGVARGDFTVSTLAAYGRLFARRRR